MEHLPDVVSREAWLEARKAFLEKEKAFTRLRDELNADRRRLPMVRIDTPYTFDGPEGPVRLLDLFEGRSQLIVHHVMWTFDHEADGTERPRDVACSSCSTMMDLIPNLRQLHVRNTSLVAISRGPYAKIAAFRERMGWTFPWYSSWGSAFNYDFGATINDRVAAPLFNFRTKAEMAAAGTPWNDGMNGEWPAISAFLRVGDEVYHTYSTFLRGIEQFFGGNPYLDLTALGRQEAWEEPQGRAIPLGRQAGGPGIRLPDEYAYEDLHRPAVAATGPSGCCH